MKALVFGSLNIDKTYRVPHIAAEGETISAHELRLFCGGKGLNQAVALSRAGAETCFAGAVGLPSSSISSAAVMCSRSA